MKQNVKKQENPSPLAKRICECGCGIEFQPNRVDQFHLNSRHYDFAYNNGPRKERYAEEKDVTKEIRRSDRILDKYFKTSDAEEVKIYFAIVLADGFDEGLHTRTVDIREDERAMKYIVLFDYCYRIIKQGEMRYILIRKL